MRAILLVLALGLAASEARTVPIPRPVERTLVAMRGARRIPVTEYVMPGLGPAATRERRIVLAIPGVRGDRKAFRLLAARGFDVFCLPVGSSAEDLRAAVDLILYERGLLRVHVLGIGRGVAAASLFAERHPERTRRVVLPGGAPSPAGVVAFVRAEHGR